MAKEFEIHSFVTKLLNLRRAGRNACLTLDCKDGEIIVNLQLHLHRDAGHSVPEHQRPSPSRLRRRARRELGRATAAANAAAAKETADKAVPSTPPPSVDSAVQATNSTTQVVNAAVQAVAKTVDEAVQAGTPIQQECQQSRDRVLAEQARQPLQHRLEDLLCRDADYLPAMGQLTRVTNHDRDKVDRDRDREKDLENFTKMLEKSFNKK